jgi:tetratricopeptide (TPR) repeat protein
MTRSVHVTVAAALLALSPMVHGEEARPAPEARPEAKEATLGKKRELAPDTSLAGSIEAKGAAKVAGPTLEFETFRYAVEVQVSGKRREEISDLEKLVRIGGSSQEMPGWLFRVAELHWEEAQYLFFEANRRDDAIAASRGDPAQVDRLKADKKELERRSRAEQEAAISRYRDIFKRFPRYERNDEVLFFLGENLWRQDRRKEALDAYKALITRYPKSRYVPDAWMAYGEHYFDLAERKDRRGNLLKALETYRRAATHTESSVYGYAIYKQAWVHYNLGAWTEALDLFKAVIFFGDLPTSTIAADKKLALAREARKDYVRTYSHVGQPRAAFDDFQRVGGKDARDMLKGLAGLYYDEGKDREAIIVYHGLIVADAASPEAPHFQSRIVTAAGRMGKKALAVQQAGRFVEMLREAEKRGGDEKAKKALEEARKNAENTLRTLAVQYHAEFKKTREDAVAAFAAELYRYHLQLFPDSRQSYEMRFFHAELLYALEKFQEAGDEYTRVAQLDVERMGKPGPDGKPQKPGKFLVDALESAVQAYDLVARRAEANEKKPTAGTQPLPLSKEKTQLIASCERYLKYSPQGDKAVEVGYKAANIYYKSNHFPEAVKLFAEIAEKHPRHDLARYSANLALDCHNLQGDWKSVNAWAQRFYKNGDLMRAQPALREDLSRVIEGSAFKLIEPLEKAGRYREAADAYRGFVRDWPGSKLAPTALFNASVDLVKAGRLESAMTVREELLRRYPNDPLVPKIVLANAEDREAVADFDRAADSYEHYFFNWRRAVKAAAPPAPRAKRAPAAHRLPVQTLKGDAAGYEEAKARDALYDAGVLREGLGQLKKAETDRRMYVETWPRSAETGKVFLSVADLYGRQRATSRELKQVEEWQELYAKGADDWLVAQGRIAKLHEKMGHATLERRAYAEALHYWKTHRSSVTDRGMAVVAQAQYLDLEPEFAAYDRIDFAVPARLSAQRQVRWLKEQLQFKGAKLLQLQKSYTAVVNTKQAEPAVCALWKIGHGYQRFAHSLETAPIPRELRGNKAAVDEYRAQLSQLAEAPQKKASEALEYAIAKSRELGVSNGCSRSAAEALAKYKPDQYGPSLEKLPEMRPVAAEGQRPRGHPLLAKLYVPDPHQKDADEAEGNALPALGSRPSEAGEAVRDPDLLDGSVEAPPPAKPLSPPPPPAEDEDLLK